MYYDDLLSGDETVNSADLLSDITEWIDSLATNLEDSIIRSTLETVVDIIIDRSTTCNQ